MNRPIVLLTGALSGIGRTTAFARKGAKAVGSGRRDDADKTLVEALRSFGSGPADTGMLARFIGTAERWQRFRRAAPASWKTLPTRSLHRIGRSFITSHAVSSSRWWSQCRLKIGIARKAIDQRTTQIK
ncbi:hypothetical protein [Pseudomonas sp.]|uniref:hypothetical protein n=1 Tax=Pseudomonas sp. TaxID=306 RepID=UPI00262D9331|nr:hypothetical protein [Pseudomonas sp.]